MNARRSRLKTPLVVISVALLAAIIAGAIGSGVALVLASRFFSGRIDADTFISLTVHSEALGETRELRVHLPPDFDEASDARYPLLLVLDGGTQDVHTNRTADVLSRVGVGRPMIVVGVPAGEAGRGVDFLPPGEQYGSYRGRADQFLNFLEVDVIPAVGRDYPIEPDPLIAGWSQGGLFVTYSLIHRPDLFGARFALSPIWWAGDQAIVSELEGFLKQHTDLETFFYMSLGERESERIHAAFEAGRQVFELASPPGLIWKADITPGADHVRNPVLSTAWALDSYWKYCDEDGPRGE